jgi:glutamate synthase domain-containing protein 2
VVIKWAGDLLRGVMDETADDIMSKMMQDRYTDNLLTGLSIAKKCGFQNLMEIEMRAAQGATLERPLGSSLRMSPWETLMFSPVHLHRFPVESMEQINMGVTIGPQAKRPLKLDIPIFIAGMSYGSALSVTAKVALARAASALGTATNTGEAGLLPEERSEAMKLIGQYNRGGYLNQPDKYKQLNAIEIQLGQGAQANAPQRTQVKFIDDKMRTVFNLKKGQDAVLNARIPGINTAEDFINTVRRLKQEVDVPVGMKLAATHHLEKELDVAAEAGVDFISVDGAEGGTHGSTPTLQDDVGLPTIYGIARARRHLKRLGLIGKVSLLAGGGLITPGQFLKALALGADAVYIGTVAILALVAQQITKVTPGEAPMQMVLHTGRYKDKFDIDLGTQNLVNFLVLSVEEMTSVMLVLGHTALDHLTTADMACTDPFLAQALGVQYAGIAPMEQGNYYEGLFAGYWVEEGKQPTLQ